MADLGIGEIALAIFGAEQIGSLLWTGFEAITAFLGDEGSALMLQIIGYGIAGGDYIWGNAVIDASGIVSGFVEGFSMGSVNIEELVSFCKILSQKMVDNGISWATDQGKQFVTSFFSKLNEYSFYINAAGAASFITNKILEWKKGNKTDEVSQKQIPTAEEVKVELP